MQTKDMLGQFCLMCHMGIYVETTAAGICAQAVECDRCHTVVQRILPVLENKEEQ